MKQQLAIMLDLQNKMNLKVHENWVEEDFAWFRAVWIECGELVDHYGYKWWKKQTPDMEQVQLEIVDIWHFGLSILIDGTDFNSLAAEIEKELSSADVTPLPVIEATENLAQSVLASKGFDVKKFWVLLEAAGMSFDELFKQYVGKNVLNFFRQDHGYKDGSYIKIWDGREDNEHLSEIMSDSVEVGEDYPDKVYQALLARYPVG